jgi:hypothetical protein
MPPRFWANAVPLPEIAISNATAAAAARRLNAIFFISLLHAFFTANADQVPYQLP